RRGGLSGTSASNNCFTPTWNTRSSSQFADSCNRRCVTALIPVFASKDNLPSESTRQLPASFHRVVGNVLFRNCDQNRAHLDAHGGEQLGDGSYRHLLGAVGLPNS